MNTKGMMVGGFAITVGVITFYEYRNCHTLPWPPRIVATGLVFGLLDLVSYINADLAGVIAIGFVLAAIVNKGFNRQPNCEHAEATVQPSQAVTIESLQPNANPNG